MADTLGVEACVINYANASGSNFWCGSKGAAPVMQIFETASFLEDIEQKTLLVEDGGLDQQITEAPAAMASRGVEFLANCPLRLQSGTLIGRIWLAASRRHLIDTKGAERLFSLAKVASEMIYQYGRTARLLDAQETASIGTWDWRLSTGLVFASSAICAMFGLDPGRGGLQPSTLLRQVQKSDRQRVLRSLRQAVEQRCPLSLEFGVIGTKSCVTHCIGTLRIDVDLEGEIVGAFGACQDVTDRRLVDELSTRNQGLEDALQLANKLAEEQRNFVAIVSHEFRTPLAIIDGNAFRILGAMQKEDGPERLVALVGRIRASVVRLIGLIESMLPIVSIEAGRTELMSAPLDISAMLREICSVQMELTPERQIQLEIDGITDNIVGDGKKLHHVFSKLISNAIKYSPDGGSVRVTGRSEQAGIVVAVRDQGIGIPADEVPKLFERFFRASTAAGIMGTGYGLNIVKQFVELHGGVIDVTSVQKEGSTFAVRLPAVRSPPVETKTLEAARLSA
jgi:signal transduction histidine kinase